MGSEKNLYHCQDILDEDEIGFEHNYWAASHGAVVQIVALTRKFGDKKGEPFGGISKRNKHCHI